MVGKDLIVIAVLTASAGAAVGLLGVGGWAQGEGLRTLIIVGLFVCGIGILLNRQARIESLHAALVEKQAREIGIQEQAMNAHAIVCVADPNLGIVEVNDNFLNCFGYTRDEVIGKSPLIIYPRGASSRDFHASRAALSERRMWVSEHQAVTKSGEIRFMQCTIMPFYDEDGVLTKTVSMRTDVTESRHASMARTLNAMLDNIQDEMYIYSVEDLHLSYMNASARRRVKWAPDEIGSHSIYETSSLFPKDAFWNYVEPLLSGEKPCVVVEVMHELGPVEISTSLYDSPGEERMFVSVLRDISERRKLDEAKMETVSVVSHELRTPLTSIIGSLRLLQSGAVGQMPPQSNPVLDIANRNSEHLLMVINDILDYEKFQAGKMEFETEPVDLAELLSDAAAANKGYGDALDIGFVVNAERNRAFVDGNAGRLMQVMANLMSNAAKFSPAGSDVRLGLLDRQTYWRVTITDRGPGIPDEARRTIFDSFTQVPGNKGRQRKGTGLGLAISKKIVELHAGTINFDSVVGQGTTFYFDLPKAKVDRVMVA